MDEQQVRTLMDTLARDPQPASSIDLATVVARGHRRRTRRRTITMAAAAVVVVAVGGTGLATLHSHPSPPQNQPAKTGTLHGYIYSEGGPPLAGSPRALPGTITVTGNGITRRVNTSPDGSYTVPDLPPGSYALTGHSPYFGNGTYACQAPAMVHIQSGHTTAADALCEMN
jgi:hypothetical protein